MNDTLFYMNNEIDVDKNTNDNVSQTFLKIKISVTMHIHLLILICRSDHSTDIYLSIIYLFIYQYIVAIVGMKLCAVCFFWVVICQKQDSAVMNDEHDQKTEVIGFCRDKKKKCNGNPISTLNV